jgi:hypothetical protein
MAQTLSNTGKIAFILSNTKEGLKLLQADLSFLEEALNRTLDTSQTRRLNFLYQSILDGTYEPAYLCDVTYMTLDADGYIYFKGQLTEHFNLPFNIPPLLKSKVKEVQQRCLKMEKLGLPIGIANYLDYNIWVHVQIPYDPFLFFIDQFKTIYQKGRMIMFYHFETDLGQTIRYRFTEIDLDTSLSTYDQIVIPYYFHHYAEQKGFQKVAVEGDSYTQFHLWQNWIRKSNFKPWYFGHQTYSEFSLKAMDHGHITELPEKTYLHFKKNVPTLSDSYDYQDKKWLLTSQQSPDARKSHLFRAVRSEDGKYFGVSIPIDKNSELLMNNKPT